jgi:hypothetical protein
MALNCQGATQRAASNATGGHVELWIQLVVLTTATWGAAGLGWHR